MKILLSLLLLLSCAKEGIHSSLINSQGAFTHKSCAEELREVEIIYKGPVIEKVMASMTPSYISSYIDGYFYGKSENYRIEEDRLFYTPQVEPRFLYQDLNLDKVEILFHLEDSLSREEKVKEANFINSKFNILQNDCDLVQVEIELDDNFMESFHEVDDE